MKLALVVIIAAAGCDNVFGLQHIPERTRDAALDDAAPPDPLDGRQLCTVFGPPASYPVGDGPHGLTITDLTGDGAPDIAVANAGAGTVTVLKNAGDGTFGGVMTGGDLVAEGGAGEVIAVRIDADATVDLISSNFTAGSLSVFFGQGGGVFQSPSNIVTGASSAPLGLAAGSFAGTSEGDLAVAFASVAKVAVFLWNGSGYTAAPTIDVQLQPSQVVAVNLDGDGVLDLAVANTASSSVSIALGAGNGTFAAANHVTVGSLPRALAAAPLAPGMATSLFVASSGDGSISLLRNDGTASFASAIVGTVGAGSLGIAAGDLDGDTLIDLAITNSAADRLYLFGGNGQGAFTARPALETGDFPVGVGIADFDRDGNADVAVANQHDDTVSVFLGCH